MCHEKAEEITKQVVAWVLLFLVICHLSKILVENPVLLGRLYAVCGNSNNCSLNLIFKLCLKATKAFARFPQAADPIVSVLFRFPEFVVLI